MWDPYYFDMFFLIVLSIVVFVIGVVLSLKYTQYKKYVGIILTAVGIFDIIPYIAAIINLLNRVSQVFFILAPTVLLALIGCITLIGGVTILKQAKRVWILLLIIATIIQFLWTVTYYF